VRKEVEGECLEVSEMLNEAEIDEILDDWVGTKGKLDKSRSRFHETKQSMFCRDICDKWWGRSWRVEWRRGRERMMYANAVFEMFRKENPFLTPTERKAERGMGDLML
jgi:hypothetical protein